MVPRNRRLCVTLVFLLGTLFGSGGHAGSVSAMPAVKRTVLPNGLVVLYSEDRSLPLVTLQLLLDAGSRRDPEGQAGVAGLTARGLLLGTSGHKASEINEALDFIGASFGQTVDKDWVLLGLQVLKKDLNRGLGLFLEVVTEPVFPREELRNEVQRAVADIRASDERPEAVAERAFQRALFVSGPYRHPVEGTEASVLKLTREQVQGFFNKYYHPNNAILAVVGDLSPGEFDDRLVPRLKEWPKAVVPQEGFSETFAEGPETVHIRKKISQANIVLGNQGVSRSNPDYYCLSVMNYILGGGGFGSRLMEAIRVKRGLAYSVGSFFEARRHAGSFQVYLQTRNASAQEGVSLALREMERIQQATVSTEELETAKKYLTGSFPLRLDTQAERAGFLVQMEYFDLGLDYPAKYPALIDSVTKRDVLRVAGQYLHPAKRILVVVGDLEASGQGDSRR